MSESELKVANLRFAFIYGYISLEDFCKLILKLKELEYEKSLFRRWALRGE